MERAAFIRQRLPDFVLRLPATLIALGSTARLPGDYAAGHALGVTYSIDNLPDEQTLTRDLRSALQAYRALTFRGGLDTEPETEVGGKFEQPQSLTELRSIDCIVGLNAIPPPQRLRSDTTAAVARHVTSIWGSDMVR